MIDDRQFERIIRSLPWLTRADPDLVREFRENAFLSSVPPGKDVFIEGDSVQAIPLLISGVVRVYQIGETGREVTLYRFRPGESCVLTANAILRRQSFPAIATVEEQAEAVMIPADCFRDWVRRHELWRDFYFDLVSQRLASVMGIVEEVAFRRLDARVASLLLGRAESENPVRITHQEIASELGSSREVISRILEDFSGRGAIRTERGAVEVLDFGLIKALSET
jgi:CRP/FNR family transcriptional regulator